MIRRGLDAARAQSGTRLRADYSYGVASIRTGTLDGETASGGFTDRLESLAGILPEVFGSMDAPRLLRLWERLGGEAGRGSFQEIVIAGAEHVHVIEPLARQPGRALVTVASTTTSLGLVLQTVHAKVAELELEGIAALEGQE